MIVRNLPYKKLNKMEKKIVRAHRKDCKELCSDHPECKTLNGFWETHREADTDYGTYEYDGWKLTAKRRNKK